MATTGSGTPYVQPSDHPLEYPALSQQLAQAVDKVGVHAFATAAARAAAIPSPTLGKMTFLNDSKRYETWDGTGWRAMAAADLGMVFMSNTINNVPANTATRLNITVTAASKFAGGVTLTGGCLQLTTPGRYLAIARAWWTASLTAGTQIHVSTGTDVDADSDGGTTLNVNAGALQTLHESRLWVVSAVPQKLGLWVKCSVANSPVGGSLEVTHLGA